MLFDKRAIQALFSSMDFANGREYYRRGQVQDLRILHSGDGDEVTCVVQGSEAYYVSIRVKGQRATIYCSCPRFADRNICKHIAAAMLACEDLQEDSSISGESDNQAQKMLRTYMEKSARQMQQGSNRLARLIPRICPGYQIGNYPSFSFQVGFEKLYVVRDIKKFAENIINRETVSYGKGLELCHSPEQFDPDSQKIISILVDQFMLGRTMRYNSMSSYYDAVHFPYNEKNRIVFTGSAFDRLFDLFLGKQIDSDWKNKPYTFEVKDPAIGLSLKQQGMVAELRLSVEEDKLSFFGSAQHLYAIGQERILRCSRNFRENVYPFLKNNTETMRLSLRDMPTFCSCVLPEIQDAVTIDDPAQLLQEYLPDECIPCFRFDLEDDVLSLQLDFRYDDVTFNCFGEPKRAVKRDIRAEQAARAFVEQSFPARDATRFIMTGDDAVYDFLMEGFEKFQALGDVYVTDRLRDMRLRPSRPTVGISVSDGTLRLDFDTGGFPPEELEALYQSLLKRKRYYRLSDGRYLPLDGSSCETLAEMAHILQISPGELKKGQVKLPPFRALYLNSLLSGQEDIQIRRDQWFRELVRDFKAVPEGGYPLPEELGDILRPYQKEGFQWLKTLEHYGFGGILADEMGLGKTLQMIAFLASLGRTDAPSLIVCPASLILNWADELDKFAPGLTYTLIMGNAKERAAQIASDGERDIWITSYELLRQDIEQYAPLHFTCCVLDEAQHIKNQSTLASKAVKQINCRQRFVLTGTPIENRLSELWNLFDFLMPGYLFSHASFVQKLEKPAVKSKDEEAMDQLRRLVRPFLLRRMKKDVLKELPPKIEHIRRISLSEEERKVYCASSAAVRQLLDDGDSGKIAILAALTELRQICCAPDLRFENYTGPSSKLEACIELCAGMVENGHQILLFSQFTSMLDRLRTRLDDLNISHFTLQGSTPKAERAQLVKSFNAGGASVFLISLKAGGTGLNLTAADVVIHYDPWWNPAAQEQATDRAHRIGQRASVQVYKLIAKDTIEEKIMTLQSKKAGLMDMVTDGTGSGILDMSKEELLALLD